MSVRLVVSIEAGTGTEWQAALLAFSLSRAAVTTPLTVLCAGGAPREPMLGAEVIVHPSYRRADGGNYAPLNKPGGIRDWLERTPPAEDELLLLDPDVVALGPLPAGPAPGCRPRADYFPLDRVNLADTYVRNLTRHPELLQSVGIPIWIARDLLRVLAPRWIDQTVAVRRSGSIHSAWVAEMVGYQLAAADLGISHEVVDQSCGPALLHYYTGHCGLWWRKARYRPWEVPAPIVSTDPTLLGFHALLSEYAAQRRAEVVART